ncbi:OprD family porin [Pseudomonas guariconensis]|uniref:OprD family porin n=1 Tax=Pseudomonas guariconensis TaxID=1288410 RepID=UPI00209A8BA3|nr:OprD family porin [Pseudomonas guariconensis]MCO7632884.1 OprD family porin [Pseudomonas guariconensis]
MLHRPATLLCSALLASDVLAAPHGLVEDSQLELRNRNFYFNRDLRNGASNGQGDNAARPADERKGYREEWAHGLMLGLDSGFTQGTLGLGLDAHAHLGLKLDSGAGRTGTLLLPVRHDRQRDAEVADDYSHAGAALKARWRGNELKWGEMHTSTPVFTTADSRLLPELATGLYLRNDTLPGLLVEAGHFTAYHGFASSNDDDSLRTRYSDVAVRSLDFLGASYSFSDTLRAKLFHARAEDNWLQYYLNLNQDLPFTPSSGLNLDLQLYRSDATGRELSGPVANTSWSLAGAWRHGPHRITLAYQQIDGDTPFDYVGGLSIDLANSVQLSDFNAPGMKSRQARYDLNLAGYGVPGLSFMTRYVTGSGASDRHWRPGQRYAGGALSTYGQYDGAKWHELDMEVRYVVQAGPARDLSLRTRVASYRGNRQAQADLPDINEVRLIVEYPLSL